MCVCVSIHCNLKACLDKHMNNIHSTHGSLIHAHADGRDLFTLVDSRFGKLQRWGTLALKYSVYEHPVLAIAEHVKVRVVEKHFQMFTGDETAVSHVDIDVPTGAVSSNNYAVLPHHVLEFAALEARDHVPFHLGAPLHFGGTARG